MSHSGQTQWISNSESEITKKETAPQLRVNMMQCVVTIDTSADRLDPETQIQRVV